MPPEPQRKRTAPPPLLPGAAAATARPVRLNSLALPFLLFGLEHGRARSSTPAEIQPNS